MILTKRNMEMVGMLLLWGSFLIPLNASDDNHRLNYNNCSDYVYISGETNINHFYFLYNKAGYSIINHTSDGQIEIAIPVKDFTPGSQYMYKDFLILLRESEYPFIYIRFPENQIARLGVGSDFVIPEVKITIGGVTNSYSLNCSVRNCSGRSLLMGSEPIKLSDFNIQKMEKFGGLIKLRDEITVRFGFIVNFTYNNQISSLR